jgi:hypothetical protein
VNVDGTVDVAHQGWNSTSDANGNHEYSRQTQYTNVAAFEAAWGASATLRYVPVGNVQTAGQVQPVASGGGRAGGGGSRMMLTPVGTFPLWLREKYAMAITDEKQ